jgi:hypothetical protein
MKNTQKALTQLRQAIRALRIERRLADYAVAACIQDMPEADALENMSLRAVGLMAAAMAKIEKQNGLRLREMNGSALPRLLAREGFRVAQLSLNEGTAKLRKALGISDTFETLGSTGRLN